MSTNYTPNYNLSQWEPSDAVRREEFNADNAKIDEALKVVDDKVSGVSSSVASHTSAIGRLGNCQVYTTSYTGVGGQTRTLSFPGYPVSVYIMCKNVSISHNFMRDVDGATSACTPQWGSRSLTLSKPDGVAIGYDYRDYNYCVLALLDMSK